MQRLKSLILYVKNVLNTRLNLGIKSTLNLTTQKFLIHVNNSKVLLPLHALEQYRVLKNSIQTVPPYILHRGLFV